MQALSIHCQDGRPLALQAWASTNTYERVQGWLKRESVEPGEGLLIVPCGSIHSFGMRFSIDVVYLDRQGTVLKLAPQVKPGRLSWGPWRGLFLPWTVQALELPAGTLAALGLQRGDRLRIESREA